MNNRNVESRSGRSNNARPVTVDRECKVGFGFRAVDCCIRGQVMTSGSRVLFWNGVGRSSETEKCSMARRTIGHLAMLLTLGLAALGPARAQQPQPPAQPPPPEHPAIEPAALEKLKAMSLRLAGAFLAGFLNEVFDTITQ